MDIVVRVGADFRQELPLADTEGVPRTFVGWKAEVAVRARHGHPPVYAATIQHRTGIAVVTIPAAASADWTFGIGRYEVWMHGPKGQLDIPLSGRVFIDRR